MSETLVGIGAFVTLQGDSAADGASCIVRAGAAEQQIPLGPDFTVWAMLVRMPRPLEDLIAYFGDLDEQSEDAAADPLLPHGADEVRQVVQRLRDEALVIGFDPRSPRLHELGVRLRAMPLHRAVTDAPGAGTGVPIGTASEVIATLEPQQARLWGRLDSARTVTHIAVGRALEIGIDPVQADLPAAFADCLELVTLGAAYLDAVI